MDKFRAYRINEHDGGIKAGFEELAIDVSNVNGKLLLELLSETNDPLVDIGLGHVRVELLRSDGSRGGIATELRLENTIAIEVILIDVTR